MRLLSESQFNQIKADAQMSPSAITHIAHSSYISAAAAPMNAAICLIGLWGHFSHTALLTWCAVTLLVTLYVYRRSRQALQRTPPTSLSARAKLRTNLFAGFYAAPWAALPLFFLGSGPPVADSFILVLSAGNCAGGAFLLQRSPVAALCYFGTILLAVAIACVAHDPAQYGPLALFCIPFGGVLFAVALNGNRVALESDRRLRSATSALAELHEANQELDRLRSAAQREAERDDLTGLLNRRGLSRALSRRSDDSDNCHGGLAVYHLDLDGFKQINDELGHAAGDLLLKCVAKALKQECRRLDLVARIGGDEFAIVAERVSSRDDAAALAQRILWRLREPLRLNKETRRISGSIGIDYLAPHSDAPFVFEAMLTNADQALYSAKDRGKDCYEFFKAAPEAVERDAAEFQL